MQAWARGAKSRIPRCADPGVDWKYEVGFFDLLSQFSLIFSFIYTFIRIESRSLQPSCGIFVICILAPVGNSFRALPQAHSGRAIALCWAALVPPPMAARPPPHPAAASPSGRPPTISSEAECRESLPGHFFTTQTSDNPRSADKGMLVLRNVH